ncbi:MAG: 8-amino-7-oxononanoate synthase [Pseudomonadales bacterium]|nr:8-amino-7-oxononanoate synthase [Pseudomonadales bacterium]
MAPALAARQQEKLYRQRFTLDTAQGPLVQLKGQDYLNFSSNDYLGLANHPAVISAFQASAKQYGVGAGASHLVVGHQQPHEQLERAIAEFTGRERALLFSSGYMANLGVLKALLTKDDVIIQDKLNHASLIDGGLASGAQLLRYRHNDLDHLDQLLSKSASADNADKQTRKILAVDGVFSMDGDIAPLDALADICDMHNVALMVDDAHGFGVLGEQGGGCSEVFGLDQQRLPIVMGTLGKAFGVSGAFVAGSHELIETLIQYSRTYIYTTALPPACAAAALQSLSIIKAQPERRQHLQDLIAYFRKAIN